MVKICKLVRYYLDEDCKMLYEDVDVIEEFLDGEWLRVKNEEGQIFEVENYLINEEIQQDGDFYMSSEVFLKAYEVFEKVIQLEKVCAEDELRRATERQDNFYKRNSYGRESVLRTIREQRERDKSSEPVIPIFSK